jgi:peptidyl-prolyl cis-trans isomerase D
MFIVQDLMRKHRRWLMWIILILIVGPFVLWGGSFGLSSDSNQQDAYGRNAIVSGDMIITADDFRQALYVERERMAQFGRQPSMEQMLADGTALRVLEGLVSRDIVTKQAAAKGYDIDQEYLTERMKEFPEFQDQNGNFNPKAWNEIVERGDINWNAIYEGLREQVSRELYLEQLMASGRVLESELKKQFEQENTTLALRYVKIQPPIEPTDEQIQATYDANPSAFDLLAKRKAAFVAVSIEAPKPALADELVERARAGEDFAALAREHSLGASAELDGDLGWVAESIALPEHQKALFSLTSGDVSDPIKGPAGYYIYKVEDERTSELSGQRDVKAREIVLQTSLEPEVLEARRATAEEIAAKVKEAGDLATVAAEYGLEVKETDLFASDSLNIENIPADDARFFRVTLSALNEGEVSNVVAGRENLYVAKITGYEPPQPQPLDAVRETVRERTIAEIRRSPEYQEEVQAVLDDIQAKAKSLEDIPTMFPELNAAIETVDEFSMKNFNFGAAPPWMPRDLYAAIGDEGTGIMVGPITDMLGEAYFVEVATRTPPDETMWAEEWPEAEKTMRRMAYDMVRQGRLDDRLRAMRETSPYPVDQAAFIEALGLNEPAESEAEDTGGITVDVTGPNLSDEPLVKVTMPTDPPATDSEATTPDSQTPDESVAAPDDAAAAPSETAAYSQDTAGDSAETTTTEPAPVQ